MSQLLLMPHNVHGGMLRFVEQFLAKQGVDYRIIRDPIEAMRRIRANAHRQGVELPRVKPITMHGFRLDPETRTVYYKEQCVRLRKKAFSLFYFLLLNHGTVIDRTTLLERVWGAQSNPFTNTVDVHLSHIRKKLLAHGIDVIKTVHGVGYALEIE
ncbi:hypothetical protein GF369_04770 [Candidatus Peregrinibacteria bacterium]|nr:hypothetical protein [Candidatus Peregrinibacteria bacterium]